MRYKAALVPLPLEYEEDDWGVWDTRDKRFNRDSGGHIWRTKSSGEACAATLKANAEQERYVVRPVDWADDDAACAWALWDWHAEKFIGGIWYKRRNAAGVVAGIFNARESA